MLVPLRRVVVTFGIGSLLACDLVERLSSDEVAPSALADAPAPVADAPGPAPADPAPAGDQPAGTETAALGSQVARIIDRERAPVAGPRGADLERVEQVTVTRMEGGWSQTTRDGAMRPEGVVFALDFDAEVGETGINQARLVAKATCKVGDEVRASSGDVFVSSAASAWGGAALVSADPGTYTHLGASLFMQQDVVGHEPCQVELRMVSPLSDRPLRVEGVWCLRDGKLGAGACEELAPPAEPSDARVRDWKVDRTRRNIEVTLDVGPRIWLDRSLVIRSSCDDGGDRVPRTQLAWGPQWGVLDPGD